MKKMNWRKRRLKFKAKDRMALVSNKNMKKIIEYLNAEDHSDFDLTTAVNFLIDIAIGELRTIDEKIEEEERELKGLLNE